MSEQPNPEVVPRERVFLQFVYGIYGQTLVLLGDEEHPATGKKEPPALDDARFLIDVLDVLTEKTRGNLTKQEEEALGVLLSQLKMRHFQKRASG
ncbi:MAG: DUF1844 domain-containing protein [Planctomycetota bacterium]